MAQKPAAIRLRSEAHAAGSLGKRGRGKRDAARKDAAAGYPSTPIVAGFLLALLVGSGLVHLFRSQLFF